MSGVDTAWLRMDRPTNLMVIVGVMIFRTPVDFAKLKRTLKDNLLRHERFLQRPVESAGSHYWETDPDFDLDRHVHHAGLPPPAGKAELEEFVSDLASTALDPSRPLWEYHLVEKYQGGSALVIRIHHCYADGIALIRVLLNMADGGEAPRHRRGADGGSALKGFEQWFPWLEPVADAAQKVYGWSTKLWLRYFEVVMQPSKAVEYAQMGAGIAAEAVRLLTLTPEPETRFRGKPGQSKRAAWCEPLKLAEVKAVGKALDATVNDVLLATAAAALRSYLMTHRDPVDGLEIRVAVPVNLRKPDDAEELGNRFGLVFLQLPVGVPNALERLYLIRSRMQALRNSPQPHLILGLLEAAGMGPLFVQEQLVQTLGAHATAVMTNVPGPQTPLSFAGAEIAEQIFWVPQSGNVGMGASILSYAGQVMFGLITDAGLVPDPQRIVDRFGPEFERLAELAPGIKPKRRRKTAAKPPAKPRRTAASRKPS